MPNRNTKERERDCCELLRGERTLAGLKGTSLFLQTGKGRVHGAGQSAPSNTHGRDKAEPLGGKVERA